MVQASAPKKVRSSAATFQLVAKVLFLVLIPLILYRNIDIKTILVPQRAEVKQSQTSKPQEQKEDVVQQSSPPPPPPPVVVVDQACHDLPSPSESEWLESKEESVHDVSTAPMKEIQPPFHFGSVLPADKVIYHLQGDFTHYHLISKLNTDAATADGKQKKLLAIDMGANQGFFTYYLATLGYEVHAFEINQQNVVSLQHGQLYNPKNVSDRVHLYKIGLSSKVERMVAGGGGYDGFLKKSDNPDHKNSILSVTFDCFAHKLNLDLSNVGFVKIDVEGFEVAVIQGAQQSLLGPNAHIQGLLIEVGPNRWNRAGIDREAGVAALQSVAARFKYSYISIRGDKQCQDFLPQNGTLADQNPIPLFRNAKLYEIAPTEWFDLLVKMENHGNDCNFWYSQQKVQPISDEVH